MLDDDTLNFSWIENLPLPARGGAQPRLVDGDDRGSFATGPEPDYDLPLRGEGDPGTPEHVDDIDEPDEGGGDISDA